MLYVFSALILTYLLWNASIKLLLILILLLVLFIAFYATPINKTLGFLRNGEDYDDEDDDEEIDDETSENSQ